MIPREVLVGVTGGIAAFKTAAFVSQLVQAGHHVTVAMTSAATSFVGEATFAALTKRHVATRIMDPEHYPLGAHIELADRAALMCVAPATADFVGKIANGIADDLLSTLYLCFEGPVLLAPAMNVQMWNKPAVQRNLKQLTEDGVRLIAPGSGWLSCRQVGVGRMAEPEQILGEVQAVLQAFE
ncbi:MAG: phosphopantothenoylcysteine decarboxylase [Planctomycetales bacterium]|nr:phosphopantothenoylcysteine decarboxylase [Planctomycetales bacterium]